MFPKESRIKDASFFEKAFRSGKPFSFGVVGCRVFFLDGEPKRVGFSISKKLFPKAVMRNKAKRMIFEAFKIPFHNIPDGVQLVFFLRDATLDRLSMERDSMNIAQKINMNFRRRL